MEKAVLRRGEERSREETRGDERRREEHSGPVLDQHER